MTSPRTNAMATAPEGRLLPCAEPPGSASGSSVSSALVIPVRRPPAASLSARLNGAPVSRGAYSTLAMSRRSARELDDLLRKGLGRLGRNEMAGFGHYHELGARHRAGDQSSLCWPADQIECADQHERGAGDLCEQRPHIDSLPKARLPRLDG